MAKKTILLTRQEISSQIDLLEAIPAIEQAMAEFEKGRDYLPPKAIFHIPLGRPGGAIAACITGYTETANMLSIKVGQERSDNQQLDGRLQARDWRAVADL